ncbi:IS3 family transposase [Bacillus sp. 1NLA3E]
MVKSNRNSFNCKQIKTKLKGLSPVQYRTQTLKVANKITCLTIRGQFK